jgi:small-conductance mechanosensitive channel
MPACRNLSVIPAAVLAAFLSVVAPASGQNAVLDQLRPGAVAAPDAATQPAWDSATARDQIRKAQADAQALVDAIESAGGTPVDAPPDTPKAGIISRLTLARQLVGIYQQQQDALDRAEAARQRQREVERASENWRGFDGPPPYSVLRVDALRDELDAAEDSIRRAQARRTLFERIEAQFAAKLKESQATARMAAEAAAGAHGTPQFPALEWQRNLSAQRASIDAATQALLEIGIRGARDELAASTIARDFARRKIATIGSEVALPADELARVLAEVDSRRRAAERDLERATKASAQALAARTAAQSRVAAARAAPATAGEGVDASAARVGQLERDAEMTREAAVMATQRVDLLREYLLLLDGERAAWEARAWALQTRDPVQSRASYDRLTTSLTGVRAWMEYLTQQLSAIGSRIRTEEATQRNPEAPDAAQARGLLDILRERELDLRRAIDGGQPLERLLARFRADFEDRRDVSLAERLKDLGAGGVIGVRRLWNYEMFAVDDSLEMADGRKLSVSRSVTVGKTFGAVLIVVIGYLLSSFIARRVERTVVARGRIAPQAAALLRKWALFALAAGLVIFALVSASIPITAFAFLGGALALAAGFGLQNLLKNLVAGIMLLVERPLRLGDLLEIDGLRGRITEIGIRASTIRSADGIETMIPNSRFIEGSVTNWTYSSPQTRQAITVGVTYGTPLRKAADVLLDVLSRHGHVLKDPGPQVYLDAYADSSVNFALMYWVEMTVENDSRRVKSDLLHMIDRAFDEAGIRMPFPQRDVHLDVGMALPVQIVPPPTGAATAV